MGSPKKTKIKKENDFKSVLFNEKYNIQTYRTLK